MQEKQLQRINKLIIQATRHCLRKKMAKKLKFESFDLTESQLQRMDKLIDRNVLTSVLKKGCFVAGGSVVYVLNEYVHAVSVEDVDVYVPNRDFTMFVEVARIIHAYLVTRDPDLYMTRSASTLTFHVKYTDVYTVDIQLILSAYATLTDICTTFDFDYTMCGLYLCKSNTIQCTRTEFAATAHATRKISRVLDRWYAFPRFNSRIRKCIRKGFVFPTKYKNAHDTRLKFRYPDSNNPISPDRIMKNRHGQYNIYYGTSTHLHNDKHAYHKQCQMDAKRYKGNEHYHHLEGAIGAEMFIALSDCDYRDPHPPPAECSWACLSTDDSVAN